MPGLSETIAQLSKLRGSMAAGLHAPASTGRLSELPAFGSNPGMLRARRYVPEKLSAAAPLVVVLHGCTQTADGYDAGSGWSQLADRYGFALLFPEQQRQNNPNLCFNWFSPEDNGRGRGEALSIRQMIDAMIDRHGVDPARVFVTGLSAGGAMAAVMLASYPELFAGGAVIAGLPYGCAGSVQQAFEAMRGQALPGETQLAALARNASGHRGAWPTLSVWHGSADATVHASNADALVGQWRSLHQLDTAPSRVETVDGHPRRVWCDDHGRALIEEYRIAGMSHGTPLDTVGAEGCGKSGAFMLEAGISSTRHICRFWGLAPEEKAAAPTRQLTVRQRPVQTEAQPAVSKAERAKQSAETRGGAHGTIANVIENALRSAGLMR